jgi:ABC-type transporter Mla subunit MlaD
MAEAETLVKVLEGLIAGQTRLGEMIQTVHERAETSDLAIVKLVDNHEQVMARLVEDHQQAMARLVDGHQQAMARLVETQGQMLAQALQSIGQSLQAIMQSLERIVSTTDRTERMTAEILARLASTQGTSH